MRSKTRSPLKTRICPEIPNPKPETRNMNLETPSPHPVQERESARERTSVERASERARKKEREVCLFTTTDTKVSSATRRDSVPSGLGGPHPIVSTAVCLSRDSWWDDSLSTKLLERYETGCMPSPGVLRERERGRERQREDGEIWRIPPGLLSDHGGTLSAHRSLMWQVCC